MKKSGKMVALLLVCVMVSSFITMPIGVSAADSFSEDFESPDRVYHLNASGMPFPGYLNFGVAGGKTAKTVDKPNGVGKSLEVDASGVGGTIWMDVAVAKAVTGIQIFETDLYIPTNAIGSTDYVSLQMSSGGTVTSDIIQFGADTATRMSNSTLITQYPKDKWFKVQYAYDYRSTTDANKKCIVKIIEEEKETTVRTFALTGGFLTDGLGKLRYGTPTIASGVKYYVDNIRYYDAAVPTGPSQEASTYFEADFNAYGIDYNFTTNATNYGMLRVGLAPPATAKTVANPNGAGKVLKVDTNEFNKDFWIKNNASFDKRTTGVQIVETSLYFPEGQLQHAADAISILLSGTGRDYKLSLMSPNSTTAESANAMDCKTKKTPIGRWFKLQYVLNYNGNRLDIQIVDGNTTTIIGKSDVHTANFTNADGITAINIQNNKLGSTKTFYIGYIKAYEADNLPINIDFERYAIGNVPGQTNFIRNYADTDLITSLDNEIATGTSVTDPSNANNTCIQIDVVPDAKPSNSIYRIDTQRYLVGAKKGITVFQFDVKLPEPLAPQIQGENPIPADSIVLQPNYAKAWDNAPQALPVVTLKGDKIWATDAGTFQLAPTEESPAYPINEWFTVRFAYNHENSTYDSDLVKRDGTVINLIRGAAFHTTIQEEINTYGFLNFRLSYNRYAGNSGAQTIYFDNLKIENLSFGTSDISYNGSSFVGTVNYVAKGDVSLTPTLVLALYGQGGNVLENITYAQQVFVNGSNSITIDIPSAQDVRAKLMLWRDFASLAPFIPVSESN